MAALAMGHRRVGILPRTNKWRSIVAALPSIADEPDKTQAVVASTLDGVRTRFSAIDRDPAVNAAFKFLVTLAVAARSQDLQEGLAQAGISISGEATPLRLSRALADILQTERGSGEYGGLSRAAAADALAAWFTKHEREGPGLFESESKSDTVWRDAGSGSGFCELARLYFAKFTERHLKYFLDREASAVVHTLQDRETIDASIRNDIDAVSKHAFETAEITQSFAAGWFTKHAAVNVPTDRKIQGFLAIAFGKLREELRREGLQ